MAEEKKKRSEPTGFWENLLSIGGGLLSAASAATLTIHDRFPNDLRNNEKVIKADEKRQKAIVAAADKVIEKADEEIAKLPKGPDGLPDPIAEGAIKRKGAVPVNAFMCYGTACARVD
jgi:hypothetical protein